jgi:hypothetical protein
MHTFNFYLKAFAISAIAIRLPTSAQIQQLDKIRKVLDTLKDKYVFTKIEIEQSAIILSSSLQLLITLREYHLGELHDLTYDHDTRQHINKFHDLQVIESLVNACILKLRTM